MVRSWRARSWAAALCVLAVLTAACEGLVEVESRAGDVELGRPLETSSLLAADGSLLAELHAEQDREVVPLSRIPRVLQDAVVAVEDERFWEHSGVDARAIARALVVNLRTGEVAQGGSTITQQLAKLLVVGDEVTLDRKLAEASVALQLEAQLSKGEILERYLNTVYFGNGTYGASAAARGYFGVDVEDLDLPQAALLAGLLRAPSATDPFHDPQAARERRDLVLGLMAEQGMITAAERDAARAAPVELVPPEAERWRHPYAVDHVLDVLHHDPQFHVLGDTPAERAARIHGGGLVIETTIDPVWQAEAEAAVAATLDRPGDPSGALVAIDPATGAIRALVGGRDYYDPDDPVARFNLAVDGRRQPGSAFKPLVLAAALAGGVTLDDTFPAPAAIEIPLPGGQQPWQVGNAGGQDFGTMTVRQATTWSVNTVYAQLVTRIGPEAVVEVARAAGITSPLQPYHSLALGAQEVSPLEMASVMATFAAGGVHRAPAVVQRITDADGVVIWERPEPHGVQVVDPEVAWQVTLALQDVVSHGTGTQAELQRPVAGKTGTSQDHADAWFAGFTPDLAAAVWVGFPEGRVPMEPPRTRIPVQGGAWPAEIFARFGLRALVDVPASGFPIPDSELVVVEVDVTRDCLPNPYTPRDVVAEQGYLAGTEPTEVCAEPTGPPTLDVPDVRGLRADAARAALVEAGFSVIEQLQHSAELPPGVVIGQDPPPGAGQELRDTGYVATIQVSSADRTEGVVPDVLNFDLNVARERLEDAGFVVRVELTCPGGGDDCTGARTRPGQVWEQTPDVGAEVPVHSVVLLRAYPAG